MKKNLYHVLFASGLSIALLNGCTGSEVLPNNATQTGAATGALAGAVLGYNTKGHNSGQRAIIGGLLGAAAGGAIGNTIDNQKPKPEQTGGWE